VRQNILKEKKTIYTIIKNLNPILSDKFSWIYDNLIRFFETHLNKPVTLITDGGIPGFHIFVSHWVSKYPIYSLHYDTESPVPSKWFDRDVDDYFSFTLPIRLPASGGGLFMFDETSEDISVNRKVFLRNRPKIKVHYEVGTMVIQDGRKYHMIAPAIIHEGEYRMTLQGHGLLMNDTWYLYF
jgi:hypothetical protein